MSEVLPIHKNGDHELPMNNLSCCCPHYLRYVKELPITNSQHTSLQENSRLSYGQCRCRDYHPTETSVLHTTDYSLQSVDNKKLTTVVLLDMSVKGFRLNKPRKTVAKITARRSLPCCESLDAQLFVKSVSSSTSQYVLVQTIVSGIIIYQINDPFLLKRPAANINSALQRFQDWRLETDQLLLNPKLLKTKLLLFGSRLTSERVDEFHVSLMGKRLTTSHAAKDLGVFLDCNWAFNKHWNKEALTLLCFVVKHAVRG